MEICPAREQQSIMMLQSHHGVRQQQSQQRQKGAEERTRKMVFWAISILLPRSQSNSSRVTSSGLVEIILSFGKLRMSWGAKVRHGLCQSEASTYQSNDQFLNLNPEWVKRQ
jgi:hypothetical protein